MNSTEAVVHSGRRPEFAHVILTRFNVRYVEDPNAPSIGVDPAWLEDRFKLFEQFCLPSVVAQSEPSFSWILYFDRATPEPFAERARALASLRPGIFPIFCDTLDLSLVSRTIQEVVQGRPEWLLTSRLDNDDGIHRDFVATVQGAQSFSTAEVLNCPIGIIIRGQQAYRRRDASNAFISLSEPYSDFASVFSIARHIYASDSYPLRQIAEAPMWLQIIHQNNISNRVRGWRMPMARAASEFPCLGRPSELVTTSEAASILTENLSASVLRMSSELIITSIRRVLRAFGLELRRGITAGRR